MTQHSISPVISKSHKLGILPLIFLAASCVAKPRLHPISEQAIDLPDTYTLLLEFEKIDLELIGSNSPEVTLSGSSSEPELVISAQRMDPEEKIRVTYNQSTGTSLGETTLAVLVPANIRVEIRVGTGSVHAHDFDGQLAIHTTSAPIIIDRASGHILAISRRGSIQITESQGEVDAIAEADDIQFADVRGEVTGTNIMGAIHFDGMFKVEDRVHLEVDHGAVNVTLDEASDVTIQAESAGGRIICTLTGMSGAFESCQGRFGNGSGELWIRTVSGAIRIDQSD